LLRTRFVAGDRVVGADFITVLQELLYQKRDEAALAHDILSMRKRMEEEVGKASAASYNIKQGCGGLVDIEFIAQYLQLLHGERHPRVRVAGTINALHALRKEKLLADNDYHLLAQAYEFIRRLESRLRIVSNQASSLLSREPEKMRSLALRMGYSDEIIPAGAKLLGEYELMSGKVRHLFERILRSDLA
jgi:glutamate-ammonia-ligase adenylyltransferase